MLLQKPAKYQNERNGHINMKRYEAPVLEIIQLQSIEMIEQSQNSTEFILEPFDET